MRVERYEDGQVQKQVANPAQMSRVDTGADLLPNLVGNSLQTADSMVGKYNAFKEKQDSLDAREKLIEFSQASEGLLSEFAALRGSDAASQRGDYVQRLYDLRRATLNSAEGSLGGDVLRSLDLQIRERVISGTSTIDAGARVGQREYDLQSAKDLTSTYLAEGYGVGQSLRMWEGGGSQAPAQADFNKKLDAFVTSSLATRARDGLLSEATMEGATLEARSAFGLAFLKGAANAGDYAQAVRANEFLGQNGIVFRGADADAAKQILTEKKEKADADDRRAKVAQWVTATMDGARDYSSLSAALAKVPDELRTEVTSTVQSQWNFRQSQKDADAIRAFDEANRLLYETPGATPASVIAQNENLFAAFRDNKDLMEKFLNRTETVTDFTYFGPLMATPKEELARRYHEMDAQKKHPSDVNPMVLEFMDKLSPTDRRLAMARLDDALTGRRASDFRNQIEANFGQDIREQIKNQARLALGFSPDGDMSAAQAQKYQAYANLANAAFEREFARMEAAGEKPIIQNVTMRKLLNEVSLVTRQDGWWTYVPFTNDYRRELKDLPPETVNAVTPLVRAGVGTRDAVKEYSRLENIYGAEVAREAIERFSVFRTTNPGAVMSSEGMDTLAKSIRERNKRER